MHIRLHIPTVVKPMVLSEGATMEHHVVLFLMAAEDTKHPYQDKERTACVTVFSIGKLLFGGLFSHSPLAWLVRISDFLLNQVLCLVPCLREPAFSCPQSSGSQQPYYNLYHPMVVGMVKKDDLLIHLGTVQKKRKPYLSKLNR